MINNLLKWLENIWNLRKIFDKYLPQIKELMATIKQLKVQIEELESLKKELEETRTTKTKK